MEFVILVVVCEFVLSFFFSFFLSVLVLYNVVTESEFFILGLK